MTQKREFENIEKCILAADSLMKKSKAFILFTYSESGGDYVFCMQDTGVIENVGLYAYAKEKCERVLYETVNPMPNEDGAP